MTFPYGLLGGQLSRMRHPLDQELEPELMSSVPQAPRMLGQPGIAPVVPQGPQDFGSRLMSGLFPVPEALRSIISPEDAEAARRQGIMSLGAAMMEGGGPSTTRTNFAQNLGRGIGAGQNAFTAALQNAAQLSGYAEKLQGEREAKAQQKQVLAGRAKVLAKYPPQPGEDVKATAARLQKMLPELIAINDTEMVGKIVELLKSQGDLLGQSVRPPIEVDAGNEIHLVDPVTRQTIRTIPKGAAPRNSDAQDALRTQREITNEDRLVTSYQRQIKDRLDAADFVNQTMSDVRFAMQGDGTAQVAMLYAFVKALDPASVVREGEVALAREAAPWVSRIKALADGAKGEAIVVPKAVISQMERLLARRLSGYEKYIDRQRGYYITRAQRANIGNPDAVFLSARDLLGDSNVPQGPPNTDAGVPGAMLPDMRSLLRPGAGAGPANRLAPRGRGPGPGGY